MTEFYTRYRTHDEILHRLNQLEHEKLQKFNLEIRTKENRDIKLFVVGTGKKNILITGGVHAREWLTPIVSTYIIEHLLKSNLLDDYTFYIIPIVNPDGYIHSFKNGNRMWRKNMNGVDINRNFSKGFGKHSGSNPDDHDFRGTNPFSENETKALRKLIKSKSFYLHLDIHSYGQLIAGSWAYKNKKHPNHKQLEKLGNKMVSAMKTKYVFGHGSMNGKLGLSGGTFQDYTSSLGVHSFTIELPTKTSFDPHPNIIKPTGKDMMRAIKSVCYRKTIQNRSIKVKTKWLYYLIIILLTCFIVKKIFNLKTT